MKQALFVLSVLAFIAAFGAAYGAPSLGVRLQFSPPYAFASNDALGIINAFAFSFLASLFFFGYGAPIAMLVEGAKYGSFFVSGAIAPLDVAFAVPSLFACFAGIALGQGALREWRGTGSFFEEWRSGALFFAAGVVLLGVLLVAKKFFGA